MVALSLVRTPTLQQGAFLDGRQPYRLTPPWRDARLDAFMSLSNDLGRDAIADALTDLQARAGAFSQPLPREQSLITLQVVLVVGAPHSWRLIETRRTSSGRRWRQMRCFASLDQIRHALDQHLAWQREDRQFVARHMATPGGLPGVTGDWVPSEHFDSVFAAARDAIRNEFWGKRAEPTVPLP